MEEVTNTNTLFVTESVLFLPIFKTNISGLSTPNMLVTLVFKEFVVGMASFYSASLHATDPTSQDWFQPGDLARWIYVKKKKKKHRHRHIHVSVSMWTKYTDRVGGTWMILNQATLSWGRLWGANRSPFTALFMWTVWRRWLQEYTGVHFRACTYFLLLVYDMCTIAISEHHSLVCVSLHRPIKCVIFAKFLFQFSFLALNVQCVGFL